VKTSLPPPAALARFVAWLVASREKNRRRLERARPGANALFLLGNDLPCRAFGDVAKDPAACAGVIPSLSTHAPLSALTARGMVSQRSSFPCPCKLYAQSVSKPALATLLHLPWEILSITGGNSVGSNEVGLLSAPSLGAMGGSLRAWNLCGEDDLAPRFCRAVLSLYGARALAPLEHPFSEQRVVLKDVQRASLRELLGVARALRIVNDVDHGVYSWSLIKDAYLQEVIGGQPATFLTRADVVKDMPAGGRALVLFDTLSLKAAGGSSPECTAVALFLADLYERGSSLVGFSRLPLTSRRTGAGGADARSGGADDLARGLQTFRDERGRLRVTRTRSSNEGGQVSFESALDESAFERLAQMIFEGERSLLESRR